MPNDENESEIALEYEDIEMESDGEDCFVAGENGYQLGNAMMNELLLICSNLGLVQTNSDETCNRAAIIKGEDCEEWIHDLQRAIRRDHEKKKLVCKQLGKWKIVQKKLLPLLLNHQHDWSLVFSILKILVMLTMKPSIDSIDIPQQLQYLREYKSAILSQHVTPVLMAALGEPLSRQGTNRTSQDYLNIELILTLFRNILATPNENSRNVTSATEYLTHLQEDFIKVLYHEQLYEMILLIASNIESPEYRDWNLLILEIMDHTLACCCPHTVADYFKSITTENRKNIKNSLLDEVNAQKIQIAGRHSNFGGVLKVQSVSGNAILMSDLKRKNAFAIAPPPIPSRRRGKKAGQVDSNDIFRPKTSADTTDKDTIIVVSSLCESILTSSYYPLANSLKNEFRRGSSKLVPADRLQYFHFVWFLLTYQRERVHYITTEKAEKTSKQANEKAVLATLDMFSFNFVLQSVENYESTKNHTGMCLAVKVLKEKMAYVSELLASQDLRLVHLAQSIQHKLFYERDFLDRLPLLIRSWTSIHSVAYATDVLVLKGLDAHGHIKVLGKKTAKQNKQNHLDSAQQAIARKEADFDLHRYFRSMLNHDTIQMYAFVLGNYRENSVKVNHYVHSFFHRVSKFQIEAQFTTKPMLFHIRVLTVFNMLLHDEGIKKDQRYCSLLAFIQSIVRDFFALAERNHLLYVEALLRQPYAIKSCVSMQRIYEPSEPVAPRQYVEVKHTVERISDEGEVEYEVPTVQHAAWSSLEDRHLSAIYKQFRDRSSKFELLSEENILCDRTPTEIEQRVKELGLDSVNSSEVIHSRKRLRRVVDVSSDSEEEIVLQTGNK
ncbi:unnamed protein product [Albugo candida]|nr:unnamed protein product [Albugo candida]|eukprot:CCI48575.1 unnamed protein product [Albugo candida]